MEELSDLVRRERTAAPTGALPRCFRERDLAHTNRDRRAGGGPCAHRGVKPRSALVHEGVAMTALLDELPAGLQSVRRGNATVLNVRLVLEASGGDLIGMTYGGLRH